MNHDQIWLFFLVMIAVIAYLTGAFRAKLKQQDLWRPHMEKCNRYIHAVDDLDRWCGHTSPHARLIARHLRAQGEGLDCNAGTPVADEACTVDGLREQLQRLPGALPTPWARG